MTLSAGQRLGPYQVSSRIGVGGMGEVYRATDTRLNRAVAIKILLPDHSAGPEFAERFEREARALSSFSHPHICTVYDFGSQDECHYLVMEYLEGETLSQRLRRGRLPFDEFVRYSLHVASALVEAHRQGYLHRDIKPANIMLTKSGAKLLDFGLTRSNSDTAVQGQNTRTKSLTTEGAVVGTYPYMSPEQLQGRVVDVRSDIFSFGAVLYEMATGVCPFDGESTASIIAAVLDRDPPALSAIRPDLPPALAWVVHTCLRKDSDERWQSVHDLKLQIERLRDVPSASAGGRALVGWKHWRSIALGLLAGAFLSLVAGAAYIRTRPPTPSLEPIVFEIAPASGASFTTAGSASIPVITLAVSPDGSKLAYVGESGGSPLIWVRKLNEAAAHPLRGTEGAQQLFWSPDSRWIAFFSENALKKIELSGGPATTLSDVSVDPRGGAWLPSGTIVFAPSQRDGLMRISSSGGSPTPLYPQQDAAQRWWPSPLPDGKRFIFLDRKKKGVFVGSVDGAVGKPLVMTDWAALYADPGYLLYFKDGFLNAHRFDTTSGELEGEPIALGGGIGAATNGMAGFSASRSGILAHSPLLIDRTQLLWYDRGGNVSARVTEQAYYMDPALSPDEQKIALTRLDVARSAQDIWIHDQARGTTTRFTSDPLLEASPLWSGDGTRILYRANRTGMINLYIRGVDGGVDRVLFQSERQLALHGGAYNTMPTSWSSNGGQVIYTVPGRTGYDIFVLRLVGDSMPQPLAKSAFNEMHGSLSPDQRWLAFASDESGRFEVYVQSFPDGKRKQQLSAAGGWEPKWRADGGELYFLSASRKLMAVPFAAGGHAGKAQELFPVATPSPNVFKTNYAPSRDGRRFLINAVVEADRSAAITVVANWPGLVRR
jgi:eukaryotic-like serine/threonine-protein kinase